MPDPQIPQGATGILVLADGTVLWGRGFGATGHVVGEVCFNTAMTGYQEVMTDPSYAGQIITFTFPHIGNVGTNTEDLEREQAASKGMIVREDVTDPSSFRASGDLREWAASEGIVGLSGIDTRALTHLIRAQEAPAGVIAYDPNGQFDLDALKTAATSWPGLEGMDLAKAVTRSSPAGWDGTRWALGEGFGSLKVEDAKGHVVAVDYGAKDTILRCLTSAGLSVTVVPATARADEILALKPDGVFLSNGPGDPAATATYALPVINALIEEDLPIFGICLGHQLLSLALGGKTFKMKQGHRGANHPVKDITTNKVEITSMNHGFAVDADSLPDAVHVSHISLFDGTVSGIRHKTKPIMAVQQHPEASPGPQDSYYLFDEFAALVETSKNA